MNEAKYNAFLTLPSGKKRAFLIADTILLRKTGKSFDHIRKLYDPSYLGKGVDFVCSVSQGRIDEESREKLKDLWFPRPEKVKFMGIKKNLYTYRLGKGSNKERVVVSNKCLSKKLESYYKHRWYVEIKIRVIKSMGLEGYRVRSIRAIRLWVLSVWHLSLIRLRAKLEILSLT